MTDAISGERSGRRPLLVSHTAQPGGSNEVLLGLLRHRPPEVQPACVFLAAGPTVAAAEALGASCEVVAAGRAREAWRTPGIVAALVRAMRRHHADVAFAHVSKAHLYAAPAAALCRLPYLWWTHEVPGQKRFMHAIADRLPARLIICSSRFTAEAQRRRSGSPPAVCVYPGVEPAPAPRASGVRTGGNVGLVGRLQRWKRVELLLDAAPALFAAEPRARVVVMGGAGPGIDSDYPAELRGLAQELGVADAVRFVGHVDDVQALLGELDVLVHTAEQEPFGLALVEAMLAERPVVAPNEGGPAEIVRHDEDGLLIDVEDPDCLAASLVALLRDPDRRERMGRSGRERALECFTAQRMAAEAWALVDGVATRHRAAF